MSQPAPPHLGQSVTPVTLSPTIHPISQNPAQTVCGHLHDFLVFLPDWFHVTDPASSIQVPVTSNSHLLDPQPHTLASEVEKVTFAINQLTGRGRLGGETDLSFNRVLCNWTMKGYWHGNQRSWEHWATLEEVPHELSWPDLSVVNTSYLAKPNQAFFSFFQLLATNGPTSPSTLLLVSFLLGATL